MIMIGVLLSRLKLISQVHVEANIIVYLFNVSFVLHD